MTPIRLKSSSISRPPKSKSDLLQQAERDRRLLSFSLAELFPSLAPHVLSELDRGELDAVSDVAGIGVPGGVKQSRQLPGGQHQMVPAAEYW